MWLASVPVVGGQVQRGGAGLAEAVAGCGRRQVWDGGWLCGPGQVWRRRWLALRVEAGV